MDEKNIENLLNASKDLRTSSLPFSSSSQWFENKEFHRVRVLKKGWLEKQTRNIFSSWKAKWSVLSETDLSCYENEYENKNSVYIIPLKDKDIMEVTNSNNNEDEKLENNKYLFKISQKSQFSFTTSSASRKSDIFAAKNDEDRKDWIKALKKAMFGHLGGAIFGASISDTLMQERKSNPNHLVPQIVSMCCSFIEEYGLHTEGIFRLSCRLSVLKKLREQFDRGIRPSLILPIENGSDSSTPSLDTPTTSNIHTVCCLLKTYLLELPEPIIPVHFYEDIMTIVTRRYNLEPESSLQKLSLVISRLPPNNYNLLSHVCSFLARVGDNEGHNRMSHANLAKVFCNAVIRPEIDDAALLMGTADNRTTALSLLIYKMHVLFDEKYKAFNDDSYLKRGVVKREKKNKKSRERKKEDDDEEDCFKQQPRRSSSLKEIHLKNKLAHLSDIETLAGKGAMVNGYEGGEGVSKQTPKTLQSANQDEYSSDSAHKNSIKFHSIDDFLNEDLKCHSDFYQDVSECLLKNGISLDKLNTRKTSKRHCFMEGHTAETRCEAILNTPHQDLSHSQLVSLCTSLKNLLALEKNRVSYLESQLKLKKQ